MNSSLKILSTFQKQYNGFGLKVHLEMKPWKLTETRLFLGGTRPWTLGICPMQVIHPSWAHRSIGSNSHNPYKTFRFITLHSTIGTSFRARPYVHGDVAWHLSGQGWTGTSKSSWSFYCGEVALQENLVLFIVVDPHWNQEHPNNKQLPAKRLGWAALRWLLWHCNARISVVVS